MKAFLLVGMILIAQTATARLSETEEQCKVRYGLGTAKAPTPGCDKTTQYEKEGVKILADFINSKCVRIVYEFSYPERDQEHFDAVFKAEGGSVWANYSGGSRDQFARNDGATAEIIRRDGAVVFMLPVWVKANAKAEKDIAEARKAEKKAIKDSNVKAIQKGF